ncbi:hypothetical protein A2U01_0094296, partial [Trifolium medium]|nr:hypothetical protein [Trifolium medium]
MPSTRAKGERLEQVNEPESLLNFRRRIREYRTQFNLPDPDNPITESVEEPEMAEVPQNRPLKSY